MGLGNWLADRTGIHPTAIAHTVGGVLDNKYTKAALAAGLAATGVGAPAAAAIMAGEGLLGGALHEGGGLKDAAGGAATGALSGAAAGMAGGALRGGIPSLGSAVNAAKGIGSTVGTLKSIPGVGDALSHVPGLGAAADFLGGNGGQNALMGAQAVNAAMLSKKSSDYADNAMGSTQANWDERAPLRTAGQAGLLNPGQGIAPKISGIPNRNLYSKPAGPPSLGPARIG